MRRGEPYILLLVYKGVRVLRERLAALRQASSPASKSDFRAATTCFLGRRYVRRVLLQWPRAMAVVWRQTRYWAPPTLWELISTYLFREASLKKFAIFSR